MFFQFRLVESKFHYFWPLLEKILPTPIFVLFENRKVTKICCWSLHKQLTSNDCIDDIHFSSRIMYEHLTIKLSQKHSLYMWNRNLFLTSDTDISSRWIPSKHFQIADIFNSELLCLKKNGILQKFCNGRKTNFVGYMWFDKKVSDLEKTSIFQKL